MYVVPPFIALSSSSAIGRVKAPSTAGYSPAFGPVVMLKTVANGEKSSSAATSRLPPRASSTKCAFPSAPGG
jgi:hypothetical protein